MLSYPFLEAVSCAHLADRTLYELRLGLVGAWYRTAMPFRRRLAEKRLGDTWFAIVCVVALLLFGALAWVLGRLFLAA